MLARPAQAKATAKTSAITVGTSSIVGAPLITALTPRIAARANPTVFARTIALRAADGSVLAAIQLSTAIPMNVLPVTRMIATSPTAAPDPSVPNVIASGDTIKPRPTNEIYGEETRRSTPRRTIISSLPTVELWCAAALVASEVERSGLVNFPSTN